MECDAEYGTDAADHEPTTKHPTHTTTSSPLVVVVVVVVVVTVVVVDVHCEP